MYLVEICFVGLFASAILIGGPQLLAEWWYKRQPEARKAAIRKKLKLDESILNWKTKGIDDPEETAFSLCVGTIAALIFLLIILGGAIVFFSAHPITRIVFTHQ